MSRNVKYNKANPYETDSDREIWFAIRYLDPDIEVKTSDVAVCVVWIVVLLILSVFIYLLHH